MFVRLASAVLLCSLYVYYDLVVYRDYLLRGDDPAFISASLESPASWFTQGYLNYFNVYPEWGTRNTTPLLKPVTNAIGYLNYWLFGSSYALHFATFFLVQFFGLLVFVRILRELAIPPLPSAGMSLLFLFNPAFMNVGLLCLPCQFDVLAGVFALAAFLAAWLARYGLALLLLSLAVFTKESAVYAPVAAAACLMIWRRPMNISALMILPLALWAAARFLAYGDVLDTGSAAPLGDIAAGLSVWPTGLVPFAFIDQLASSLPYGRSEILATIFLIANVGLWVLLCRAAMDTVRQRMKTSQGAQLTAGLLVWTLGALSFGVLAGYNSRYGGSIYPLLYLLLSALFFSPDHRASRWVVASVLFVFSAATAVQNARIVRFAFAWESVIAFERALHDTLESLPQNGQTVYVINAPSGVASAPRHLSRAWSLDLNLVIVNQFSGCTMSADPGSTRFLDSGSDLLSVRIPDCAAFNFPNARLDVLGSGTGLALERDGVGTYNFSAGKPGSGPDSVDWGRTLTFQIETKGADPIVVGYDWNTELYTVLSSQ
jgi:hypothetical protein